MAAFNKFNIFTENLCKGVHIFGTHTLRLALTDSTHKPVATNTVRANLTEVSYTNFSGGVGGAGNLSLNTVSCVQTAGETDLILTDLVVTCITATTPGFCEFVLYNDTPTSPADPLICWWEYPGGANQTLAVGETITIDFDAAGALAIV